MSLSDMSVTFALWALREDYVRYWSLRLCCALPEGTDNKMTCPHLTNLYLPVLPVSSSDRRYSAFGQCLSHLKVTRTRVCDERVYLFHTDRTNSFAVRNRVNPRPFYVPPAAYQYIHPLVPHASSSTDPAVVYTVY
jgi:hypothetical protein